MDHFCRSVQFARAQNITLMKSFVCFSVLLLLVSCQQSPRIINHQPPTLSVDFDVFNNADCHQNGSYCDKNSLLLALGCHRIEQPSSLLGGLTPSYPIAICWFEPFRPLWRADVLSEWRQIRTEKTYLYETGCHVPAYARFVIRRNDQFEVLKTEGDFRRTFAPIETADEALSYALAVRGLLAYYGLQRDGEHEYYADSLEDTHVTVVEDGYRVHLYYVPLCACDPKTTFAVDLHITPQGVIREVDRASVYRDIPTGEQCVN